MSNDKYKNYIGDLGVITTEYAREAIQDHSSSKDTDEEAYKAGYMMAFHRIVTLMQQQADAFEIPLDQIGLAEIDEKEFLK